MIGKGIMRVSGGTGNVLFLDLQCGYMGCTFLFSYFPNVCWISKDKKLNERFT